MSGQADLGLSANGQVLVYSNAYVPNNINGNDCGLFGDGTTTTPDAGTLQPVSLPAAARALAARALEYNYCPAHACAILTTGALYCWGSNESGECAVNGLPPPTPVPTTQVTISGVSSFVSVATGIAFTCATDGPSGTGKVYCWGVNDYGELGNGGYSDNPNPVPAAVLGLTSPAAGVVAGDTHACAWLQDGTAMCWGRNDSGQLGSGDYDTQVTAVPVKGLVANVAKMAALSDHTCALYTDGRVACWGSSYNGQVGNGYSNNFGSPTTMAGLP
jgi:alpha-tubulin suppressor-like RCC1 family protein